MLLPVALAAERKGGFDEPILPFAYQRGETFPEFGPTFPFFRTWFVQSSPLSAIRMLYTQQVAHDRCHPRLIPCLRGKPSSVIPRFDCSKYNQTCTIEHKFGNSLQRRNNEHEVHRRESENRCPEFSYWSIFIQGNVIGIVEIRFGLIRFSPNQMATL